MYRRIIPLFLSVILWANAVLAASPAPQVEAEAAVLMVVSGNQVLFEKNGKGIMYPASTTKIMTLITALEKGNPNNIVTVSSSDAACEGSSLELKAGNQLTLRNAMYGMMLVSGNDAAEAIAENVAGSIPSFVELMNANAEKLGTTSTHFTNPHGLPDPINHYTTAHDLALITAYGMKNPEFVKIVSTRDYDVNFLNRSKIHVNNTNKLLKAYPSSNGVKTGYTNDAGDCLVASAKRGEVQLIAVILNSDYRWDDATKLLDYGFQQVGLDKKGKPY
ncbi:MAG: Serine-type D-Ala-D-Ala carboxypeptidase [Pelosinus sp.]|jgi:D-alanyl-D-alanine carboxypeptidase (penicillin-binding protein 5/6)|nr:Serine-type D-Ala-D-Ala carboxypeptidase [Pelosinus sp.]